MAKPEKPTASTKNEMATPFVCEKPTTSSRVASIPNPDAVKDIQTNTVCLIFYFFTEGHFLFSF